MIKIERASEADFGDILKTEKEYFSQPLTAKTLEETAKNPDYTVLAAKADGIYAGHAVFYIADSRAEIISVAIKKSEQKKGYGKALLSEIKKECRKSGIEEILLDVRISNSAAVALYKIAGFEIIAERKNFYEYPQENAYTMKFDLKKDTE